MLIYVLAETVDSSEMYAETNILLVSRDFRKCAERMHGEWSSQVLNDPEGVVRDSTSCGQEAASVVWDGNCGYFSRKYEITKHEVEDLPCN